MIYAHVLIKKKKKNGGWILRRGMRSQGRRNGERQLSYSYPDSPIWAFKGIKEKQQSALGALLPTVFSASC